MNYEKDTLFVSSRGIAYNCEVYPKNLISDTKIFDINDYNNIKNCDKVYVISSVLNKFCCAKSLKDFLSMKLPIKQISNQIN